MKRLVFITLVMFLLLLVQQIQAGVSVIMNGSFENNGHDITDITTEAPKRWCDVNIPDASKFSGKVTNAGATHGDYSLTLYSKASKTFVAGEIAMVSQAVYLVDVNEIIFDIELSGTHSSYEWDPEKFSAIVIIDGNVVWDSNVLGVSIGNSNYSNVGPNDMNINDANFHTLSLAMRANKNEYQRYQYNVRWDFVKFDTFDIHCGGFGYLPEDLNRDCNVDSRDFALLAGQWLLENPDQRYDLVWIDKVIVDGLDLGAFTEYWLARSDANGWAGDANFPPGLLEADLNDDGIVDFRDFTILSGDWKNPADCTRADIDCSKMVDYKDVLIMADEWLMKSWLYGL